MGSERHVDIPPPAATIFRDGINHPDLWLWDSWTFESHGSVNLFALALARKSAAGVAITPADRNRHTFHVRRFLSRDDGRSWRDCGAYLQPSPVLGGAMAHNVWSGSAAVLGDAVLFGFTGLRKPSASRSFLQSILLVRAGLDGEPPSPAYALMISDPEADYDAICGAGYYLGPRERLGEDAGEEGGPILAWRDPFLLPHADGAIDAFWAAKTAPAAPAVAHARLTPRAGGLATQFLAPITFPDDHAFSQAEVPKVYYAGRHGYLMLISACNRLSESQPDNEIRKEMRLYRSDALAGPWRPYRDDNSIIPGTEGLFGGSLIAIDADAGSARLIAPYTELVAPRLQLTFAPPLDIALDRSATAPRRAATGRT